MIVHDFDAINMMMMMMMMIDYYNSEVAALMQALIR